MECDDCLYTDIMEWEKDGDTERLKPVLWCERYNKGRYFHPETEKLIVYLLEIIRDKGLEEFHRVCCQGYPVLTDYDGLYIP